KLSLLHRERNLLAGRPPMCAELLAQPFDLEIPRHSTSVPRWPLQSAHFPSQNKDRPSCRVLTVSGAAVPATIAFLAPSPAPARRPCRHHLRPQAPAQVSAPTKNSDQEGLRSCRTRAAKELSRECGLRTPGATSPPTIPIAACWRWRRHRSALAVLPRRCCRPPSALCSLRWQDRNRH